MSPIRIVEAVSENWDKVITALVAIYGAALSTYIFFAGRREKQRRIAVHIKFGFTPIGPELGPQMFLIEASNPGSRTVRLTSVGLRLPNGKQMIWIHPVGTTSLPHDLGEGQSCSMWMPVEELEDELRRYGLMGHVRLIGFYGDALGTTYRSKEKKLEVGGRL